MRTVILLALAVFLLPAGEANVAAQGKTKTKADAAKAPLASPFSSVVRAHCNVWDLDRNGKLTPAEIDNAVSRPRFKGDAAAALATLKSISRDYIDDKKHMPPATLDQLTRYEEARAGKKKVAHRYDQLFREYQRKLQATPRELFPERIPKLTAIKQGDIGDCYFMCMIGALVHLYPQKVCRMIEPRDDGRKYAVHFVGAPRPVQIGAPTDAEIALNTSAEQNGLWLTVLEKAFAARENRRQPTQKRDKSVTDAIAFGGSAYDAIAILTGHGHISVDGTSPKFPGVLKAAVSTRCLIATTLLSKSKAPPRLIRHHVYAVIAYNPKTHHVTVFDPRGLNFSPQGKAGPANGYEMKAGVLVLPLREYVEVFDGIGYEDRKTKAKH